MKQPIIPPQSATGIQCPVCNRPIYPGIEHNPLCAAIANLQSMLMKSAGVLEEDQAERWADLHQRMTGVKAEVVEKLEAELESVKTRLASCEDAITRRLRENLAPPENRPESSEKPENESGSAIITS
jgi:hypothetical protein